MMPVEVDGEVLIFPRASRMTLLMAIDVPMRMEMMVLMAVIANVVVKILTKLLLKNYFFFRGVSNCERRCLVD